jgi:hypothetical protein
MRAAPPGRLAGSKESPTGIGKKEIARQQPLKMLEYAGEKAA